MTPPTNQAPVTPAPTTSEQLLLSLAVPDSTFRQTLHVVCDAGPLVTALESGIPDASTLLEGFLNIPLPDWTLGYDASQSRAITSLTAEKNSAGTHPFTIHLARTAEFLGTEGALQEPQFSYQGSIHYSVGGMTRDVLLHDQPQLVATLIAQLEARLQEPSVRDHKVTQVEGEAKEYASNIDWLMKTLTQPDVNQVRAPLHDELRQCMVRDAKQVLLTWVGDGYRYEMATIAQAFRFSLPSGEFVALARVDLWWCDAHGNRSLVEGVLIGASQNGKGSRFREIVCQDTFSGPESFRKALWKLTEE